MTKYAYAERVVKKVGKLLRVNPEYKEIMSCSPTIELGVDFCLDCIYWNYYNLQILVASNGVYYSNGNNRQQLLAYNGFDSLLSM